MRVEDNEGISNIIMTILTNNLDWLILYDACPIYRPMAHIPNMIGTFTSRLKGPASHLTFGFCAFFFCWKRNFIKQKQRGQLSWLQKLQKVGLGRSMDWSRPELTTLLLRPKEDFRDPVLARSLMPLSNSPTTSGANFSLRYISKALVLGRQI